MIHALSIWRGPISYHRALSRRRVEEVIAQVAAERSFEPAEISGTHRLRDLCHARWECWRRLEREGYSISAIARVWGCNHATILSALGRLGRQHKAAA